MPIPEQFESNEPEDGYDAIGSFDWKKHVATLIESVPQSDVYDKTFTEFIKYRSLGWNYNDEETSRVGFRIPPEIADWFPQVAYRHNMHATRYAGVVLELGMILLKRDYHDKYSVLNHKIYSLFSDVGSDVNKLNTYAQLRKQTIQLNSAARTNKSYYLTVQKDVADTIASTADILHCTKSDLSFVCVCIGIMRDNDETPLPTAYVDLIRKNIEKFEFELNMLYLTTRKIDKIYDD
jgi:hypothetical protein